MSVHPTLATLREEMDGELRQRILPYWIGHAVDTRNGGFVGLVNADGVAHHDAPKGSVLNARILWTFSAAARVLGSHLCLSAARRAADYFGRHFVDPEYGGVYWMVDAAGNPIDDRKHVYAQAFAVYALSEHFRATHDEESLRLAIQTFLLIEKYAHDGVGGGYGEGFARDWQPLDDVRLSDEDEDAPRSMNTHLHVLEAYTNLFRVWPDPVLRQRLRDMIRLFLDTIVDGDTARGRCFFGADWTPLSDLVSYGHDIEASWLVLDAAEAVGDAALRTRARQLSVAMAAAVLQTGYDPAGGIFNEGRPDGVTDTDKEWWPQAEAIVGFLNAFQQSGQTRFLDAAWSTWTFTRDHIADREGGEWLRRVARDGTPRPGHEKVGPWKCPYHNARACLQVMARVEAASNAPPSTTIAN
jgi:cellobiose epimerase